MSPPSRFRRDFTEFVSVLRRDHPPKFPVRVFLRPTIEAGYFGYTALHDERFVIVIRAGMAWEVTTETLIHEWAHALTYDEWKAASHGRHWAITYGKLYQEYIDA